MTTQFTEVEFGGQTVKVPKGGYYDRYRMNPNLDEIAKDPAAGDIDFFRRFPKTQITTRAGQTWAPNFYYRTSSVQLLMLAPLVKLRVMLPPPLNPLKALPGYGLVALTFYSYPLCDNDPYNEVSVAVVVRRPGARGSNTLELLDSMKRRSFYGHVLALPVDTAIARVRGVQGYQLPKWLTQIDFDLDGKVAASIFSSDGSPDVTLSSPLPALTQVPSQSALSTNTAIGLVDGEWRQTTVLTNPLSISQQLFPRDVKLTRNGGPVSQLLDGLGAGRILRMDLIADAQMVLNMPRKATLREI
jgi:hypothetical protein